MIQQNVDFLKKIRDQVEMSGSYQQNPNAVEAPY
jgi:hypothetical protein